MVTPDGGGTGIFRHGRREIEMDLKREIENGLKTYFGSNGICDDIVFVRGVQKALLDDVGRNGKTEFNEKVDGVVRRLETEEGFLLWDAIVELGKLVKEGLGK